MFGKQSETPLNRFNSLCMQEQLFNILYKLLVKNAIRLNKEELKFQLLSHPSYPSLHAITGVLKHFGVPNLALQVPVDQDTLDQLPETFLARISGNEGEHLVLVEKRKNLLEVYTGDTQLKKIEISTFFDMWDGIVIAIEKDESIKEKTDLNHARVGQWLFSTLAVGVGVVLFYSMSMFVGIHYSLSIVGVVISILITRHALGMKSSSTDTICNLSEKTSCDAVLNSKGSKILGLIPLSDASIIVFASYTLFYCFALLGSVTVEPVISGLSVLAIPFIIYSVYYQRLVLKKWCPLCLGIVGVLSFQCLIMVITRNANEFLMIDTKAMGMYGISLSVVIVLWAFVKPLLSKKVELQKLKIESSFFKRKFSLFQTLLTENDALRTSMNFPNEIVFGNRDAPLELILVTSPMCYYCKSAHTDIENVLKQSENQIKVIVRFNVKTDREDDIGYRVVAHLLHIYNTEGERSCMKHMAEVYEENSDLEKWLEQRTPLETPDYKTLLNFQKEWCSENNINFTPVLFVLGKQYPEEYDRNDLLFFIDDLIELRSPTVAVMEDGPLVNS